LASANAPNIAHRLRHPGKPAETLEASSESLGDPSSSIITDASGLATNRIGKLCTSGNVKSDSCRHVNPQSIQPFRQML
jgi:hypothetical protein